jgi:hypothetical protein
MAVLAGECDAILFFRHSHVYWPDCLVDSGIVMRRLLKNAITSRSSSRVAQGLLRVRSSPHIRI